MRKPSTKPYDFWTIVDVNGSPEHIVHIDWGAEPSAASGFGTPGKLSSGQFSVENGWQPWAEKRGELRSETAAPRRGSRLVILRFLLTTVIKQYKKQYKITYKMQDVPSDLKKCGATTPMSESTSFKSWGERDPVVLFCCSVLQCCCCRRA